MNALFDLEVYGPRAYEYTNDDTLTSTHIYKEIYDRAMPQIRLRKGISPQLRLHNLALHPARTYSPLLSKSLAALIRQTQFAENFDKRQEWVNFQSKFGEDAPRELFKNYLGFVPDADQLVETLKKGSIRE